MTSIKKNLTTAIALVAACAFVLACGEKKPDAPADATPAKAAPDAAPEVAKEAPAPASGTAFKKAPPKEGWVCTEVSAMTSEMEMTIKMGPQEQTMKMKTKESKEKEYTILAVNEVAETKMKVLYKTYLAETDMNGEANKTEHPAMGKTVVAELKDGAVVLTDEEGKEVTADIVEALGGEFDGLGKAPEFAAFLPEGLVAVDQVLSPDKETIAKMFDMDNPEQPMTVEEAKMTFKGSRNDAGNNIGMFDVSLKMTGQAGPAKMTIVMKGNMELLVDYSLPVSMNLVGEVNMESGEEGPQASGGGAMKVETTVTCK